MACLADAFFGMTEDQARLSPVPKVCQTCCAFLGVEGRNSKPVVSQSHHGTVVKRLLSHALLDPLPIWSFISFLYLNL